MSNTDDAVSTSVKVAVRARPLSTTEKSQGCRECIKLSHTKVDAGSERKYDFDFVYGPESPQLKIFQETTMPLLNRVFDGFNATILAYGQTGSGKTFTMGTAFGGNGGASTESAGIIPRAVEELFLRKASMKRRVEVRLSFLEIHHEEIHDLLAEPTGDKAPLAVRENVEGGLVVAGLSSHPVGSTQEVERLLARGTLCRATAATHMNAQSSRSHAVCTLSLEIGYEPGGAPQSSGEDQDEDAVEHVGKLTLVDLAGSERAKRTGAKGDTLKEGISINRGLLALGNVISVLADKAAGAASDAAQAQHVPYRDSKLTRLLQESLGGSSHTLMLACISPADSSLEETTNTLRYASRARAIKNAALRNAGPGAGNQAAATAELAALRQEVKLLRLQLLTAKSGGGGQLGAGMDAGVGGAALVASVCENEKLLRRLHECERKLAGEAEAALEAELAMDRLRLAHEQLVAQAEAQGVQLAPGLDGTTNPLLSGALEDDSGGPKGPLSVLEEQRREIARLRLLTSERSCARAPSFASAESGGAGGRAARTSPDEEEGDQAAFAAADEAVYLREREAEAMLVEEKCMEALRAQFAQAIDRLKGEVAVLQQEKDAAQVAQSAKGATGLDPEQARRAKERVKELEEKLKELDRKQKEYARCLQLKERAEAEAARLTEEVAKAKKDRADLQRESRAESSKHAKAMAEEKRMAVQARHEAQKTGTALAKAKSAQQKSEHMLRLKHEEVASAMRRIKEQQKALEGQSKAGKSGAAFGGGGGGGGGAGEKGLAALRRLVDHEFNMGVAMSSCRALWAAAEVERARLQQALHQVQGRLGAAVDDALARCGGASAQDEERAMALVDQDPTCQALQAEADALQERIASKSRDMEELQDGVLATSADDKAEKDKWSAVSSLGEARALLTHLLELAVAKRVEATEKRQAAESRAAQQVDEALAKQAEAHGDELRQLRREMTEKMVLALQASSEGGGEAERSGGSRGTGAGDMGSPGELSRLRAWKDAASAELSASREQLERAQLDIAELRAAAAAVAAGAGLDRKEAAQGAEAPTPFSSKKTDLQTSTQHEKVDDDDDDENEKENEWDVEETSSLSDDGEEEDEEEEEEMDSDDSEYDDEEAQRQARRKTQAAKRKAAAGSRQSGGQSRSSGGGSQRRIRTSGGSELETLSLDTTPEFARSRPEGVTGRRRRGSGGERLSVESAFSEASEEFWEPKAKAKNGAKAKVGAGSKSKKRAKGGGEPLPPPPPLAGPLEDLKVPELKEALRARGLAVSGKKQELIDRLREHGLNEPGPEGRAEGLPEANAELSAAIAVANEAAPNAAEICSEVGEALAPSTTNAATSQAVEKLAIAVSSKLVAQRVPNKPTPSLTASQESFGRNAALNPNPPSSSPPLPPPQAPTPASVAMSSENAASKSFTLPPTVNAAPRKPFSAISVNAASLSNSSAGDKKPFKGTAVAAFGGSIAAKSQLLHSNSLGAAKPAHSLSAPGSRWK